MFLTTSDSILGRLANNILIFRMYGLRREINLYKIGKSELGFNRPAGSKKVYSRY